MRNTRVSSPGRRFVRLWLLCAGLALLCTPALLAANPPRVAKIEPPNWWVGLRPDLMLLLTGENFSGAQVAASYPGVSASRVESSANGFYLFVWLTVAPEAAPGIVKLDVRAPGGNIVLDFPLLARRPEKGSFQGLTPDDVLYLIMPDRFADGDPQNDQPAQSPGTYDRSRPRAYHGGDLRGIREHLPYLKDLGVTALWLTPVYDNDNTSPEDYHGYGAVDYYGVDEHLGTLRELQELVTAAHAQGIKIVLDNVPNHIGPKHPWVKAQPQPDWFHGTLANHLVARSPFDGITDPHAPPRAWRDVVEGWFANVLPDMNQENPRVAAYQIENSLWWIESTGINGFRLDTFPYVSRRFWSEFHRAVFAGRTHFFTVGEVFNPDPTVTAFFAGGRPQFDGIDSGVSAVFDYPFYFALRDVLLRGAPPRRLADVLQRDWLYAHPENLVTFLGNHDVKRFSSEPGATPEKLKLACALLLTTRGIPQLYAGDEIGLRGGDDPDNRRDFPGGFPGDPRNAFSSAGRTAEEQGIFQHVQALLRLRREHSALRQGRQVHLSVGADFYAYVRIAPEEKLLVFFNRSEQTQKHRLNFDDTPLAGVRALLPLFSARPAAVQGAEAELEVAPRNVAIYLAQ